MRDNHFRRIREGVVPALPDKKVVMGHLRGTKLVYENMYNAKHQLGYSFSNGASYGITIANDAPNQAVKDAVLLHELGHIYFNHVNINMRKEAAFIESEFKRLGVPFAGIEFFGGIQTFCNLCMDCQINETLLSTTDIKALQDIGFPPCTPTAYGFEDVTSLDERFLYGEDGFRVCYEPLIKLIPQDFANQMDQMAQALSQMMQDLPDDNNQNGSGGSGGGAKGGLVASGSADGAGEGDGDQDDQGKQNPQNGNGKKSGGKSGNGDQDDEGDEAKDGDGDSSDKQGQNGQMSDEAQRQFRKHPYNGGDKQHQAGKANKAIVGEETVGTAERRGGAAEDSSQIGNAGMNGEHGFGGGRGTGHGSGVLVIGEGKAQKVITNFLQKLIKPDHDIKLDKNKPQLRGTRRNDAGIMYSQVKYIRKDNPIKLGILVDCSCSMDTNAIRNAVLSIKPIANRLKDGSKIMFYDTSNCGTFDLKHLPNDLAPINGGGTDMAAGFRELTKEGNFTDLILYSDFMDDLDACLQYTGKAKVYGICTTNNPDVIERGDFSTCYGQSDRFLKELKKLLIVDMRN